MIYRDLKKITNIEELNTTISFLKQGFNWSSKRSTRIKNSLIKHNGILGFYGFVLLNNESKVIGAILTPFQGVFQQKSIVNLSAWYVLPLYRGINSIYMAKLITKQLKNFVITNFSPNTAALNIFETIGFRKMESCTTNYFLPKYLNGIFKYLLETNKKIKIISKISSPNKVNKSHNGLLLKDAFYINLAIQKEELNILINKSSIERKLGFLIISFPRLHILWSSNNSLLKKSLDKVIPFLMVKNISPIISNHCNDSRLISPINIWRYHLQYSKNYSYQVSPIGGEYSINL